MHINKQTAMRNGIAFCLQKFTKKGKIINL
nr:MAG TPA: hypothetical protein [Caudoviricetes sp.]DAS83759.1 MAG TPA: hypothetical protein [Caudoviricetes sp.]